MPIFSFVREKRLGIGLAILGIAAVVFAGAMALGHAKAQGDATTQLNRDLIRAKADLEGWQMKTGRGNLAVTDYRAAFGTDLQAMGNMFRNDSMALLK